ncbi:MAG: PQQ-binding-like beta-propeller repeat protein [bacterium]
MYMFSRMGAVLAPVLLSALAAFAAPAPWVVALDKAQDKAPVVLVLQERDGKLSGEAFLSLLDSTAATTDVSKLTRTDDTLKGDVTVTIDKDKTGTYKLDGTVKDNILTGSYKGKTGDTDVEGTISWGQELLPLGHALFLPSAAHPVGFRGDYTGCFPAATPVSSWEDKYGTELGKNVIWKTPMPTRTNSTPIVVGNKVFTLADPDLLICADALTGKILWQKQVDHLVLWPADEAKKAREAWNQQLSLYYEYETGLQEEWLLKGGGPLPPVKVTDAEVRTARIKKLVEEKNLALAGDTKGRQGYDLVRKRFASGSGFNDFGKAQVQICGELYAKYGFNFEQWRSWITYTHRTPTSDGKFVYVAMGYGQVACYDLDGNMKWMQFLHPSGKAFSPRKGYEQPGQGTGPCPSPILIGDLLIVHGKSKGDQDRKLQDRNRVVAIDKNTGKILWEASICSLCSVKTPIGIRVGGVDYIVLARGGGVLRASDGKRMDPDVKDAGGYPNMASNGNRVFFNWCANTDANPGESFIAAMDFDDKGASKEIWRTQVPGACFIGPTAWKGMLYLPSSRPPGVIYSVQQSDGKTNRVVIKKKNGSSVGPYPVTPPSVAGDKVFWADAEVGTILITETGADLKEVNRMRMVEDFHVDEGSLANTGKPTLDEFLKKYGTDKDRFSGVFFLSGGPFFQGGRMYLRTSEYLYCIGDATKTFQSPNGVK